MKSDLKRKSIFLFLIGLFLIIAPFFFASSAPVSDDIIVDSEPAATFSDLKITINVNDNGRANFSDVFNVTFNREGLTEVVYYVPYAGKAYSYSNGEFKERAYYANISDFNFEQLSLQSGICSLNIYRDEIPGYITIGIKAPAGQTYPYGETYKFKLTYSSLAFVNGENVTDEFYLNLLGANTSSISNVSFAVIFPNDINFSEHVTKIYLGEAGSTKTIEYATGGDRAITGSVSEVKAGEYLTIWQPLEEGYFASERKDNVWFTILFSVSAVLAILAVIIKLLKARFKEVISPVEVLAFEGLTPEKAELYAKLKITTKSLSALIIYFASKGYIDIVVLDEKQFKFIKKKDYYNAQTPELNELFAKMFDEKKRANETGASEISVMMDALAEDASFYNAFEKVIKANYDSEESNCYEKSSENWLIVANFLLAFAMAINFILLIVINPIVILGFVTGSLDALYAIGGYWAIRLTSLFYLILIVLFNVPHFTKAFALKRGRVLGYKNYITKVEKNRIIKLVKETPNFFFDVLPYAHVLGVTSAWINQFKDIELAKPNWIVNNSGIDFSTIWLITCFNHIDYNFHRAAVIRKINSVNSSGRGKFSGGSFSGFGGGGFAGGGFGGGGSFGAR